MINFEDSIALVAEGTQSPEFANEATVPLDSAVDAEPLTTEEATTAMQ